MASETKATSKADKSMAADVTSPLVPADDSGGDRRKDRPAPEKPAGPAKPGFFTIYKKGQGYWTRVGTAVGAALLGALITWQIYVIVPSRIISRPDVAGLPPEQARDLVAANAQFAQRAGLISAAAFALIYAFFAWRMMNKPANVDFLIATDSEMKKVNWTSRKDLTGSTKVVILFMFGIALFLFLLDQMFSTIFYIMHVLKIAPPWWDNVFGG